MPTCWSLAFQSDSTRVATLLFANEGNNRSFTEIGIAEGHHHLSHHQSKAENLEKVARIDRFYMEQFAYFLGKLAPPATATAAACWTTPWCSTAAPSATATSTTTTTCPSCWPGAAAAGAPGPPREARGAVPLNNLFLGMLARMGAPTPKLGDSTDTFRDV